MTFSEVSKKYKIPRSSVYATFNKLEKEDPEKYEKLVTTVQDRQVLDSLGIRYLLDIRGIEEEPAVQDRQVLDSDLDSESKTEELISYLKTELEDKKRQYDDLYEDYSKLVVSVQKSNEHLYELAKNQQILQREVQYYKQLELENQTPLDTDATTFEQDDRQNETSTLSADLAKKEAENQLLLAKIDELENKPRKNFWQRLFNQD